MTRPLKKIELDPEIWIRGYDMGGSFLLRKSDRHLCCMGFASEAYGIDLESMTKEGTDFEICQVDEIPNCPAALMVVDEAESCIYGINDNTDEISDKKRVAKLNRNLMELKAPFRFTLKGE